VKDAYEILRQKEVAIELVRKEIAALRFVALYLRTTATPSERASLLRPGAKTVRKNVGDGRKRSPVKQRHHTHRVQRPLPAVVSSAPLAACRSSAFDLSIQ